MKSEFFMEDQLKGNDQLKSDNGYVLAIVIVILSILTSSALYLIAQQAQSLKNNKKNLDYELCILSGYNTMAKLQSELQNNPEYKGTKESIKDSNEVIYEIKVLDIGENKREFEIRVMYGEYRKRFTGMVEIIYDLENNKKLVKIKMINWKMGE